MTDAPPERQALVDTGQASRPYSPGLEGVIAGETSLGYVDGERGRLLYRGYRIGDLVAHGTSRCSVFPPIDPLPEPPGELPLVEQASPGEDPQDPLRQELRGELLPQSVFQQRSGLEVLRGLGSGELPEPPIHHLTGLRLIEASEGAVVMALPCTRWLSTSARTVQGGFTAMLAEAALAAAVFSTAPAGMATAP